MAEEEAEAAALAEEEAEAQAAAVAEEEAEAAAQAEEEAEAAALAEEEAKAEEEAEAAAWAEEEAEAEAQAEAEAAARAEEEVQEEAQAEAKAAVRSGQRKQPEELGPEEREELDGWLAMFGDKFRSFSRIVGEVKPYREAPEYRELPGSWCAGGPFTPDHRMGVYGPNGKRWQPSRLDEFREWCDGELHSMPNGHFMYKHLGGQAGEYEVMVQAMMKMPYGEMAYVEPEVGTVVVESGVDLRRRFLSSGSRLRKGGWARLGEIPERGWIQEDRLWLQADEPFLGPCTGAVRQGGEPFLGPCTGAVRQGGAGNGRWLQG